MCIKYAILPRVSTSLKVHPPRRNTLTHTPHRPLPMGTTLQATGHGCILSLPHPRDKPGYDPLLQKEIKNSKKLGGVSRVIESE